MMEGTQKVSVFNRENKKKTFIKTEFIFTSNPFISYSSHDYHKDSLASLFFSLNLQNICLECLLFSYIHCNVYSSDGKCHLKYLHLSRFDTFLSFKLYPANMCLNFCCDVGK